MRHLECLDDYSTFSPFATHCVFHNHGLKLRTEWTRRTEIVITDWLLWILSHISTGIVSCNLVKFCCLKEIHLINFICHRHLLYKRRLAKQSKYTNIISMPVMGMIHCFWGYEKMLPKRPTKLAAPVLRFYRVRCTTRLTSGKENVIALPPYLIEASDSGFYNHFHVMS